MNFSQALGYIKAGHMVRHKYDVTSYLVMRGKKEIMQVKSDGKGNITSTIYIAYSDDLMAEDYELIT